MLSVVLLITVNIQVTYIRGNTLYASHIVFAVNKSDRDAIPPSVKF